MTCDKRNVPRKKIKAPDELLKKWHHRKRRCAQGKIHLKKKASANIVRPVVPERSQHGSTLQLH